MMLFNFKEVLVRVLQVQQLVEVGTGCDHVVMLSAHLCQLNDLGEGSSEPMCKAQWQLLC